MFHGIMQSPSWWLLEKAIIQVRLSAQSKIYQYLVLFPSRIHHSISGLRQLLLQLANLFGSLRNAVSQFSNNINLIRRLWIKHVDLAWKNIAAYDTMQQVNAVVLNLGFTGRFPGVLALFLISYTRGKCVPIENSVQILPPSRFSQLTGGTGWLFYDSGVLNRKKFENPWVNETNFFLTKRSNTHTHNESILIHIFTFLIYVLARTQGPYFTIVSTKVCRNSLHQHHIIKHTGVSNNKRSHF